MPRLMMILEATLGGIRRHVVDLLRGLDRTRFETTFVYSTGRADATFLQQLPLLEAAGIRLVEVPMQRRVGTLAEVRAWARLRREMARSRPDLVHAHGAKAGALGRLAAAACGIRRFVYTPHGGAFHKTHGAAGTVYLTIERVLARLCPTDYIGVSAHSCEEIRRSLRPPADRLHRVYNGIDAAEMAGRVETAPDVRGSLDPSGDRFVVLYPAMFLEAKGHEEFVRALASVPAHRRSGLVVVLAGDGPLRERVAHLVDELALRDVVRLAGFTNEMPAYYRACDLVILPSRAEAFGYVALEAMAAGRAVLAAAAGGLPEIVRHGEWGELVDPADPGAFVERMLILAGDRERLRLYGRRGAETARSSFGLASMIEGTEGVYLQVLARP